MDDRISGARATKSDGRIDLTGYWQAECYAPCGNVNRPLFDLAIGHNSLDIQMSPWAARIQRQRTDRDHVDDPYGYCMPPGVPRILFTSAGFKILVTRDVTALLHETNVGLMFRQVFTDGRPFPTVTEPTWLGYSIGRWEADAFVVGTMGFRDGGWLDTDMARPHSDALRVAERLRRTDFGHMAVTITIDDEKAYVKPWTVQRSFVLSPAGDLLESFCNNHEKTMELRRISPPPPEPPSVPVGGSRR